MTEDTVIELAKQAGFLPDVGIPVHPSNLFKFAALVEEHLKAEGYRHCAKGQRTTQWCGMLEQAVRIEREECAKVCDLVAREIDDTNGTATYTAAAIRSRT